MSKPTTLASGYRANLEIWGKNREGEKQTNIIYKLLAEFRVVAIRLTVSVEEIQIKLIWNLKMGTYTNDTVIIQLKLTLN